MLKLALCSVEDVDHLVNTSVKNMQSRKNIQLKIEEIEAKFEKGAGSIIRMDNGSQRDPFKRNALYSELYQQLIDNFKELDAINLKLQVVEHLMVILYKTNPIGAKIAQNRINGICFADIGTEFGKSSKQVQRYWLKSIEKAIQTAKVSNGQAKP